MVTAMSKASAWPPFTPQPTQETDMTITDRSTDHEATR